MKKQKPFYQNVGNPLVDMSAYYRSIDWATWWEEFYLSLSDKGQFKYRKLQDFIKVKANNPKQREFLTWYLGKVDDPPYRPYTWMKNNDPVDWVRRRRTGGWCAPEIMRDFSKRLEAQMDGLQALKEVGNRFTLQTFWRAEALGESVDRYFRSPLLEDRPFAENMARFNAYASCQQRVHELKKQAVELYAKCNGINVDTIDGLTQIVNTATLNQINAGQPSYSPAQRALNGIVEMVMQKHKEYQLPLPEGAEETILEATAEEIEPVARKREKVQ